MKKASRIIALILSVLMFLNAGTAALSVGAAEEKPDIIKIYCTQSGIKITWSAVPNAQKYYVYRYDGEHGQWQQVKKTEKSYFTDKNVTCGKEYHYSVAVLKDEKIIFGNQKTYTFLSSPAAVTGAVSSGGITVKWKRVTGAAGYNVYRKSTGGYKKVASLSSADTVSFTDKTAKSCVSYVYCVRAVCKGCKSAYSQATKALRKISAPSVVSVANSPYGVTVKWKKDLPPHKYEIYRKSGSDGWKKAGTVLSSKTSFIDKNAAYGKQCAYKMRAVFGKEKSGFSKSLTVRALNPKKPAIALTFDDGPYSPATNKILDSLKKYGGRATFFVVGSRVEAYKDCIKREASLGCEIGCHTYNHATLTRLSASAIKKEISSAVKEIEKYSGKKVKVVRAPGGAVNDTVKANVAYPLVNWSIDTLDWKHRTTSTTVSTVKKYARDGSIVLMHDLYIPTANAAAEIIPWLTKKRLSACDCVGAF